MCVPYFLSRILYRRRSSIIDRLSFELCADREDWSSHSIPAKPGVYTSSGLLRGRRETYAFPASETAGVYGTVLLRNCVAQYLAYLAA